MSGYLADWFGEAEADLLRLQTYERGWDSYDADKPDHATIEASRERLKDCASRAGVTRPKIFPSREGGVVFWWPFTPAKIDAEIHHLVGGACECLIQDEVSDTITEYTAASWDEALRLVLKAFVVS